MIAERADLLAFLKISLLPLAEEAAKDIGVAYIADHADKYVQKAEDWVDDFIDDIDYYGEQLGKHNYLSNPSPIPASTRLTKRSKANINSTLPPLQAQLQNSLTNFQTALSSANNKIDMANKKKQSTKTTPVTQQQLAAVVNSMRSVNLKQKKKKRSKTSQKGARGNNLIYSVPANTGSVTTVTKPTFVRGPTNTSIRVRHTEYVQDLVPVDAKFDILFTEVLNPGNQSLFPWLSRLATNYEHYVIHRLAIHFRTLVSSATSGQILLAVDYDCKDIAPSGKGAMLGYLGAVEGMVWSPDLCFVADGRALKSMGPMRYVRDSSTSNAAHDYDAGIMYICSAGASVTTDVGSIWVEYDISLHTPTEEQIYNETGNGVNLTNQSASKTNAFGGSVFLPPVGGLLPVLAINNTLYFPVDACYFIEFLIVGVGLIQGNFSSSITLTANNTAKLLGGPVFNIAVNNGQTAALISCVLQTNTPGTPTLAQGLASVTTFDSLTLNLNNTSNTSISAVSARIALYDAAAL